MAKAQMDSPDCNTKLIGTGPFRCQGNCWRFGDRTTLVKNPNYWQKDAQGRQLPYLDGITFVPQEDGPKRLSSLQANDFQAMHTSQPKQITPLRRDVQDGKLRAVESDRYAEIGYVMLNNCKTAGQNGCGQASPFQYKSAREAFAYAIDRDTVNRIRNDNILTRATGPFSSEVMGYLPDTQLPQYDEAKARDAVARYKQESGQSELRFTLNHTSDPETTATATLLQQMLSRVGIRAALNAVPDQSTLINIAIGRRYDATLWRNHPGADSDTQYVWWHCNNAPPANCDNIVNFGGFNDPVINKAFDDARVATDPAVRRQHYETINRQFAKELYNLWAEWTLWVVGLKPNVHGVLGPKLPDGTDAFPGLATGHPVSAMWCEGGSC
jgi:peptide/nickel transport system substrate-binding protein